MSRWEKLSKLCDDLKELAAKHNIVVWAVKAPLASPPAERKDGLVIIDYPDSLPSKKE